MAGGVRVTRVRIEWDADFEQKVKDDPQAMRFMAEMAAAAQSGAQSVAPRGPGPEHYADGLEGVVAKTAKGWVGVLVTNDWKSHWIEFGSAHNPAFHPVRRGVEKTGVRVMGG